MGQLQQAAERRGHRCQQVDYQQLGAAIQGSELRLQPEDEFLQTLDAVIVRTMPPGSLEQVVFRMDMLGQLESRGLLIVNAPRAIEASVDKFLTTARLASQGLPTPRTIVCETSEEAQKAFEILGRDVVVKPLFGAEGRGILRVSDPDLACRVFRTLERVQSVLYVQEFIPHAGFDIRVLVLNGKPLGAIQRRNPADFRTNVSRKATARWHSPTDLEAELSIRAATAVGTCFAGVDLLYDPSGRCLVIEVNGVPGWQAFARVTQIPVADRLLEAMEMMRS